MPSSVVAYIALATVLPLGILVLAIVAIAGGRSDPDPNRERPYALYLTAAAFAGIFTLLFAGFGMATSLIQLSTDDESGRPDFSEAVTFEERDGDRVLLRQGFDEGPDEDDREVSDAVQAGLIALVGAGVYFAHDRRLKPFLATAGEPGHRVGDVYAYVTCFVALVTAAVAAPVALYGAFRAVAPGVTGTDPASEGVVQLVSALLLALGAGLVYSVHWRLAQGGRALPPEVVTPPPPPPPPAPPVSAAPVKRAPVKKAAKKTTR